MTTEPAAPPTAPSDTSASGFTDAGIWQPLPLRGARLALITSVLSSLTPVIITALVCLFSRPADMRVWWGIAAAAIVLPLLFGIRAWRRHRRISWQLDDNALAVRRKTLWYSESRVPRPRVQHLDVLRGPIQRRVGLATLTVHTAGSQLRTLTLPDIELADAERLRELLSRPDDTDGL